MVAALSIAYFLLLLMTNVIRQLFRRITPYSLTIKLIIMFMLKKRISPLLIGAFAFLSVNAMAQEKTAVAPQTLKGEVVDLSCYMDHGAHGEGHKECAKSCIKKGLPAGLLTADGQLYLLVENHSEAKSYAKLSGYAADNVAVTGTVFDKNGMKAISVNAVKPSK